MINENNKFNGINKFIRYSSIAIEMIAIIGAGAYGGVKLDNWIGTEYPFFTLGLSLFAVFASTYLIIKQITNEK
jgi:ATP synthase protein I